MVDDTFVLDALSDFGCTPVEAAVYGVLMREPAVPEDELARLVEAGVEDVRAALRRLEGLGLLGRAGGRPRLVPPHEWLAGLVGTEAERMAEAQARLRLGAGLMRHWQPAGGAEGTSTALLEVVPDGDPVEWLTTVLGRFPDADMLWLRPDQWRHEYGARVDRVVIDRLRAGGSSRAIYPARALEDAPHVIRARAEAGEQVRIVGSLPTQLGILGTHLAGMSALTGLGTGQRVVVQHEAVVRLLRVCFEKLWAEGLPVPGMADGDAQVAGRRLLLQALAAGAKDEQIARDLGISLRTVRRRVAELMAELGTASRFQAGVEAGRRGWV